MNRRNVLRTAVGAFVGMLFPWKKSVADTNQTLSEFGLPQIGDPFPSDCCCEVPTEYEIIIEDGEGNIIHSEVARLGSPVRGPGISFTWEKSKCP